jgi:heptosyltransferase-2
MPFPESVSAEAGATAPAKREPKDGRVGRNYLVCGTNWLGDSIMSMPAVQMRKEAEPGCRISVLVRSHLAPLWRMQAAADETMEWQESLVETVRDVRSRHFDRAFIFPNSFRSALVPFLARVPERVGLRGHQRAWMLSAVASDRPDFAGPHQAWEYVSVMGVERWCNDVDAPRLTIVETVTRAALAKLGDVATPRGWVGILPGAARGPAKRWPAEHFVVVGRRLAASLKCRVMVLGSKPEAELCGHVAAGIGGMSMSLAGETSLPELAALLRLCRVVICNDSGGMHLAAAVGTPVAAVFGLTDPARTRPLGQGHRVLAPEGVRGARDIARSSRLAEQQLASIRPEGVYAAALELLGENEAEP